MTNFGFFKVRDASIGVLTCALWGLLPQTVASDWVLGVLTGLCGLLLHEWGHVYGAYRSEATVTPAPFWSPFLFDLDSRRNSREQFLAVSLWGFFASGVYLVLFVVLLPLERLAGQVAMAIALFLAALTVIIEFPLAWRVYRGHPLPPVEIFKRVSKRE